MHQDRIVRILGLLSANKKIDINLLAEMLDISNVTLRKDLDVMEKRGIVSRTRGHVSLDGADNIGKRIAMNYPVKKRIARSAAEIIEDSENIMLESGSCCAMLAEEIALSKKNINIITNSIFLINYVSKYRNIKTTLLGGYYQPELQILLGLLTKKCAEQIYSQKMFIGADGFISEYGFTGKNQLCIETIAELTNYAEEIYVLTESGKFCQRGSCNLISFDRITGVFTDDGIPKEAELALERNNVKVYKVPSADQ